MALASSSIRITALLVIAVGAAIPAVMSWVERAAEAPQEMAPQQPLPHAWRPVVGEPYPDLELFDLDGNEVRLASFAGKTLLLHPIGTPSPGSIAFEGGSNIPAFEGVPAQQNVLSLETLLGMCRIDIDDPNLLTVHIIFYGTNTGPPTAEQGRAWAEHFGLDQRDNAVVLLGDHRYVRGETYGMIPGFQLVDRDFVLRADGGGGGAPDNIVEDLLPRLVKLMRGDPAEVDPGEARPEHLPPTRPHGDAAARLLSLLEQGDYNGLEREWTRLRRAGRIEGTCRDQAYMAYLELLDFPTTRTYLDDWCRNAPDSAFAHLVRGEYLIDYAWEARGGGWADTVSDEGWQLFYDRLKAAERDLERASMIDLRLPYAPAALITVAKGLGLGIDEAFEDFEHATHIDPRCMSAYTRMLDPLMEKWGGSHEQLLSFARSRVERVPEEPAMHYLVVLAHAEIGARAEDSLAYIAQRTVRRELQAAFAALEKAYPRDPFIWAQRAEWAYRMGDSAEELRTRELAAELGHAYSALQMGYHHQKGQRGLEVDWVEAQRWFRLAAEMGNARACSRMAWTFVKGDGTPRDLTAALAWYEHGVQSGDTSSMYGLAELYRTGWGVDHDPAEALIWFERAASGGHPSAREAIPELLEAYPDLKGR